MEPRKKIRRKKDSCEVVLFYGGLYFKTHLFLKEKLEVNLVKVWIKYIKLWETFIKLLIIQAVQTDILQVVWIIYLVKTIG